MFSFFSSAISLPLTSWINNNNNKKLSIAVVNHRLIRRKTCVTLPTQNYDEIFLFFLCVFDDKSSLISTFDLLESSMPLDRKSNLVIWVFNKRRRRKTLMANDWWVINAPHSVNTMGQIPQITQIEAKEQKIPLTASAVRYFDGKIWTKSGRNFYDDLYFSHRYRNRAVDFYWFSNGFVSVARHWTMIHHRQKNLVLLFNRICLSKPPINGATEPVGGLTLFFAILEILQFFVHWLTIYACECVISVLGEFMLKSWW